MGEPASIRPPRAKAIMIRTMTTLGTAAVISMRRMRPALVSGAGVRRALALDPAFRATRCADPEGWRAPLGWGARGVRSVRTVLPRAWLRGRGVDREWGLVFLFIGVHFATFRQQIWGGATR